MNGNGNGKDGVEESSRRVLQVRPWGNSLAYLPRYSCSAATQVDLGDGELAHEIAKSSAIRNFCLLGAGGTTRSILEQIEI